MQRSMPGTSSRTFARNDLNHSESARQRGRPGGIAYLITLCSGQRSATGAGRPRRSSGRTRPTMEGHRRDSRRGAAGSPEQPDRTLEPRSCSRTLHAYHCGHHVPRKRAYPRNTAALQTTPAWCSPTAQRASRHHLRKLGFSAAGRALRVLCRSGSAAQARAGPRGRASLPLADWRGGYPRCAPI